MLGGGSRCWVSLIQRAGASAAKGPFLGSAFPVLRNLHSSNSSNSPLTFAPPPPISRKSFFSPLLSPLASFSSAAFPAKQPPILVDHKHPRALTLEEKEGTEFVPPLPDMFAVVVINKKQHKVVPGDLVMVDRLQVEVGEQLELNHVLLVAGRDWTAVGRPTVPDAMVKAQVQEHLRTRKVIIFKKRRRKNSQRTLGHRSLVTILKIDAIEFNHTEKGLLVSERPVEEQDPIENRQDLDEIDEEEDGEAKDGESESERESDGEHYVKEPSRL